MKVVTLSKILSVLSVAALGTFMSTAIAITLDFTELPNEGGVSATEVGGPAGLGALTVSGETVLLFDRNQSGATGNFSGLGSITRHVFNLTEEDGSGQISDQVIVFQACPGSLVPPCDVVVGFDGVRVMFTSDPSQFDLGPADFTTIENGTRQLVGIYTNEAGQPMNVFVTSDIPEPASVALFGLGFAGLLGFSRRRA